MINTQKLAIPIVCSQILEVAAKRMYSKEAVVIKTMEALEEFENEKSIDR